MNGKADISGFRRKLQSLSQLNEAFRLLPTHAAFRYKEQLVNVQLNFQPIGRVSGNLAKSPMVVPLAGGYGVEVRIDQAIAPYAPKVSDYSAARFGAPFMKLAYDDIIGFIVERIGTEFKRAVSLIRAGRAYEYKNPFYN